MNKPDPKDYPPQSPHDLEWGGVGQKYYEDLRKWEAENLRKNPLREEEYMNMPDQKEPLFPREVLQPVYEEWKRFHATGDSAIQFYNYLLRQSKK